MNGRSISSLALAGCGFALLSAVVAALAGFGSRWGWWHFRTGFTLLTGAAFGGLAAAALSVVGAWATRPGSVRQGFALAVVGVLIGLGVFGVPWQWARTAKTVPPIHDITTDIQDPPEFRALLPIRMATGAPNSPEYGGPVIAAQQRAAWPTLGPLVLPVPPQQAFERAWAAARAMGWEIVEANATEGRIEATDTTFWFGFKDDVVVRITPSSHPSPLGGEGKVEGNRPGSRIDVRSVSRIGRGDVGTNAKRIQAYLARLTSER